jgi:hypothetical protein
MLLIDFGIDKSTICSLPLEGFCSIISNRSVQLQHEGSFYDIICDCFDQDSCYFPICEHVRYEYFSIESINSFICLVNESFDFFNFPIRKSVSRRLPLSVSVSFPFEQFHSLNDSISCPYSTTYKSTLQCVYGSMMDFSLIDDRQSGLAVRADVMSSES